MNMTDYKKHKRRKRNRELQHELIDRCIYKKYLKYVIDAETGKEYIQITEKGENSMDIDAEKIRELLLSFGIDKPNSIRDDNEFNILKRKFGRNEP